MGYAGPPQTDGKATGSLVLGILSLVGFSILAGIPAVVLGHISRKEIRESRGRLTGDGMALAGLITGYISIAIVPVIIVIIAAIAIPNLLRASVVANESTAVATVRTINTAQTTYSVSYAEKGYALDLATLGSGPAGSECDQGTAEKACLLFGAVGDSRCTSGAWCFKSGFRFSMKAICNAGQACSDYVVTATPVNSRTGRKSFCSTSDAVIRSRRGVLNAPLPTAEECLAWEPVT
jgi:type IV pilus assembly protein PilA